MADNEKLSSSSVEYLPESDPVADLHASLDSAERLIALDDLAILDAPIERNFQVLTELANKVLETPVCLITLVTNDRQFFVSSNGLAEPWASQRETKLSHSFCQHVVTRNHALVIHDARQHPLVCDNLAIPDLKVTAYLGYPIVLDENILGSFCVIDDQPRKWTTDDLSSVQKLASIVSSEIAERKNSTLKRVHLENRLRQSQKMEAIGNFTSGIAHDFNNVLAAVQIYADLLQAEPAYAESTATYLENIQSTIASAKGLIGQLLDWSRPERSKKISLSLSQVIDDTMPLLRAFIPNSIPIEFKDATESDLIFADPSQVHQILMNLCTNAEHSMRGRTGKITIIVDELELAQDQAEALEIKGSEGTCEYVRLTVSDQGVGIPPEILHRVQDPYFTTKPTGEGTGIGLWTVFGIVKNHGGHIDIQSVPDKGTTTEIIFPKANKITWEQTNEPEPTKSKSARILVVDDESVITEGLHQQLVLAGHSVVSFNCGLEALSFFQSNPDCFDLLITDQIMPEISGDALISEIKSLRPSVATIVCSGYNPTLSTGPNHQTLADAEIAKPFRFSTIATVMDRILNLG